jgi:hypothetical protein
MGQNSWQRAHNKPKSINEETKIPLDGAPLHIGLFYADGSYERASVNEKYDTKDGFLGCVTLVKTEENKPFIHAIPNGGCEDALEQAMKNCKRWQKEIIEACERAGITGDTI